MMEEGEPNVAEDQAPTQEVKDILGAPESEGQELVTSFKKLSRRMRKQPILWPKMSLRTEVGKKLKLLKKISEVELTRGTSKRVTVSRVRLFEEGVSTLKTDIRYITEEGSLLPRELRYNENREEGISFLEGISEM